MHVVQGLSPDTISAGLTILANLWESLLDVLDSLPLVEGLLGHGGTVGLELGVVGPLAVEFLEVGLVMNVIEDSGPVGGWLSGASAVVELVGSGVIPANVLASCWLSWAGTTCSLVWCGAIPAGVGAVWHILEALSDGEETVAWDSLVVKTWATHACGHSGVTIILEELSADLVETSSGGVKVALLLGGAVETIVVNNSGVLDVKVRAIVR